MSAGCPRNGGPRAYPFPVHALDENPVYAQLRRDQPLARVVLPHGGEAWLATRHADVHLVFTDPRFSRALARGEDKPRVFTKSLVPDSLLDTDPPEHTRLRNFAEPEFAPERIDRLRPAVAAVADRLIDDLVAAGQPADLMAAFATPLPIAVIFQLLDVPAEDQAGFVEWTGAMLSTGPRTPQEVTAAYAAIEDYFRTTIARRREHLGDDLLSTLIRGEGISERELVTYAVLLLLSGYETVLNLVGTAVLTLLTQPGRPFDRLCADPGLVPAAAQELLRFIPLFTFGGRVWIAREDVEVGGVLVRAGDAVFADIMSANHDEQVFDRADMFDLDRTPNPHLAFGAGPHRCLGSALATLELEVALGSLTARLPGLRLAVEPDELSWKSGSSIRGPVTLPVRWH